MSEYGERAQPFLPPALESQVLPEPWLPENYQERTAWIPAMPADFYDQLGKAEHPEDSGQLGGDHYAWLGLPKWIHHRKASYKETKGPIVTLDLGCGFPIYSELLRSLHFWRSQRKANEVLVAVLNENPALEAQTAEIPEATSALHLFGGKKSPAFQMLASHTRKVLYVLEESDVGQTEAETAANLKGMLTHEVLNSRTLYHTGFDVSHYDGRHNVDTTVHETDQTLAEMVADFMIPSQLARDVGQMVRGNKALLERDDIRRQLGEKERFGEERAVQLLHQLISLTITGCFEQDLVRPFKSLSLDVTPGVELIADSEISFDPATRTTGVYLRAIERVRLGKDHYTMDMFSEALDEIPDNSVALLTIFDSFPIYFKIDESSPAAAAEYEAIVLDFANRIFHKLKPNGRLVIFPWDIADKSPRDQALLDDMCRIWLRNGGEVNRKSYLKEQLYSWMTPDEQQLLADKSSIFKTGLDMFEVMVVQKMSGQRQSSGG